MSDSCEALDDILDSRNTKLLAVVDYLLADHDNEELQGKLYETSTALTLHNNRSTIMKC